MSGKVNLRRRKRRRKVMTDKCLMPWGMHKGVKMQDVPAKYFHWLWTEEKKYQVKSCLVAEYISRNLEALQKENEDLIWE